MSQQMLRLGEGDFSVRVPVSGTDEVAQLARGFNQSAQKLSSSSMPIPIACSRIARTSHPHHPHSSANRNDANVGDHLQADAQAKFAKRVDAIVQFWRG